MKGKLEKVIAKKLSNGFIHSVKIDDVWYGAGFKRPAAQEGEYVEFEWYTNDKGYATIKGEITVINRPATAAQQAPARQAPGGVGGAVTKDQYWENKEARDVNIQKGIQFQAARNAAINVADVLLKNDCLSLGQAKAKKTDILLAFIDELTVKYFENVSQFVENGKLEGFVPDAEKQEAFKEDA
jgi:hypothetical protein